MRSRSVTAAAVAAVVFTGAHGAAMANSSDLDIIQTVVVIYAENRSFDNLYGTYPGANGLANAAPGEYVQRDRDGSVLSGLPAVWGGTYGNSGPVVPSPPPVPGPLYSAQTVTSGAPVAPIPVTESQSEAFLRTFNHPYSVDALYEDASKEDARSLRYTNRDLYHRFYENQMQIDGGKNDMFAAWADSGGMTMGYFQRQPADLPMWKVARKYVLADNFFQAAFGGSFLNHQFLICSCAPIYPNNGLNPTPGGANPTVAVVDGGPLGTSLTTAANSPASALEGPPVYVLSGNLTPDFYAVNTMQPPYPPSGNALTSTPPQQAVVMTSGSTLPPQTQTTIGDLLSTADVSWAYYAGAFGVALNNPPFTSPPGFPASIPNFQYHHQPFNYYANYAPGTAARAEHLKDGGLGGVDFIADIDKGALPQVAFYKPQGNINEHAGYANVTDGDQHIANIITHLEQSPQWPHMLVIVTYDEFGGWWDHVAPPKGDRFGPGTRIPAFIISPYAKKGFVDHTQYDTTSILRFITRRWNLPVLPGITERDNALEANGERPMGDLSGALGRTSW